MNITMSRPVTRAVDYVCLVGWPLGEFTLGSELPYTSDVMKHMMYRHTILGLPFKDLPSITGRALLTRWEATQIPLMTVTNIVVRLKNLLDDYRYIKDFSKQIAQKYPLKYDAKFAHCNLRMQER
jgi:hypothetical protein